MATNKIKPLPPNRLRYKPVPPIQFDASLSPYEAMYKIVKKLNEVIEIVNNLDKGE